MYIMLGLYIFTLIAAIFSHIRIKALKHEIVGISRINQNDPSKKVMLPNKFLYLLIGLGIAQLILVWIEKGVVKEN